MTSLIKLPSRPVKVASASASVTDSSCVKIHELCFSSAEEPSAKFTLNINAFNGNKTNFGGKCNGNK